MFKKYGFKTLVILLILLFSAVIAYTHSGRTDRRGGHYNRKTGTYHYHNSGTTRSSTTRSSSSSTYSSNTSTLARIEATGKHYPTRVQWLTLELNARYADASLQFWNTRDNIIQATVYYDKHTTEVEKQQLWQIGFVSIGIMQSLYSLIVLIPSLAVVVCRLHDTNRSGWWF